MYFSLPSPGLVASLVASFLDGLGHPHPLLLAGCSVFGMPLGPGRAILWSPPSSPPGSVLSFSLPQQPPWGSLPGEISPGIHLPLSVNSRRPWHLSALPFSPRVHRLSKAAFYKARALLGI